MKKLVYSFVLLLLVNLAVYLFFNSQLENPSNSTKDLKIDIYDIINDDTDDKISQINSLEFDYLDDYNLIMKNYTITVIIVNISYFIFISLYIYLYVIKPFKNLEKFSAELAKGNLDNPLDIDRNNIFSSFSWSFDLMRQTIKSAREKELELIENNKTVIATLSHDIKTPIASIKLASECLTGEENIKYTNIINLKIAEVTKLTDDLFLHALTDIDKLIVEKRHISLTENISDIYNTFKYEYQITILNEVPNVIINIDPKRLKQIFSNIFENSKKYANGRIFISFEIFENKLKITIKDDGNGIKPEDLPFVLNKFYQGSNARIGAGLGLYIVNYIMDEIGGNITVKNENGAVFTLTFPIIDKTY